MSLIAFSAIEAKQVTITPVRGSVWFLSLEQLSHLSIQGDSLIVYRNDGSEYGREALVDIRKIGVEEEKTTEIQAISFPIIGRNGTSTKGTAQKVLEPDGQIVILRDGKRYRIEE